MFGSASLPRGCRANDLQSQEFQKFHCRSSSFGGGWLAQVFAWALQAADAETGRVGSNFGRAHRDKSYADCHFPDARLGMLTTWIPLVPVTTRNGCMHVVPAMKDPLLSSSEDPKHLRPDDSTEGLGEARGERGERR